MITVGHERRAADLPADTDAEDCHRLVADESDDRRGHHRPQHLDGLRMHQPADRLVRRDRGTGCDCENDQQARKILHPPKPVGEPTRSTAPRKGERNTKRNGRRRVGEVMDGVSEQRNAAGQYDDDHLDQGGGHQADEGPLQRPKAPVGGRNRGIDHAVAVPVATTVPVTMFAVMVLVVRHAVSSLRRELLELREAVAPRPHTDTARLLAGRTAPRGLNDRVQATIGKRR